MFVEVRPFSSIAQRAAHCMPHLSTCRKLRIDATSGAAMLNLPTVEPTNRYRNLRVSGMVFTDINVSGNRITLLKIVPSVIKLSGYASNFACFS